VEELQAVAKHYYRDDFRMTLDYPEDLEFFKEVLRLLGNSTGYVSLDEILQIIEKNPYIKEINFFRQKEFITNQQAKTGLKIRKIAK
ncbi:MAG: hypothetical protein QQN41_12280, partial [Nitrosopumilus sp.]